jgi:hypothetical protein
MRTIKIGAVLVTAGALLALTAAAAGASTDVTTTNGEAGYVMAGGAVYHQVAADLTTTLESENMVPGVSADAVGVQLCDNNDGFAAQLGIIRNAAETTFSVRYATGDLKGTTVDPCVGDGVLGSSSALASAALGNIPEGDTIALSIRREGTIREWQKDYKRYYDHGRKSYWVYHWVRYGTVQYSAEDVTTGYVPWLHTVLIPLGQWFYEAGAGAQRTITPLTSGNATTPLSNDLADFTDVTANGFYFNSHAVQVQSASNGNAANPQLAPGNYGSTSAVGPFPNTTAEPGSDGDFSLFEGSPVS